MVKNKSIIDRRGIRKEVAREIVNSCNKHIKLYGLRKMSIEKLDCLCGITN